MKTLIFKFDRRGGQVFLTSFKESETDPWTVIDPERSEVTRNYQALWNTQGVKDEVLKYPRCKNITVEIDDALADLYLTGTYAILDDDNNDNDDDDNNSERDGETTPKLTYSRREERPNIDPMALLANMTSLFQ